MRRTVQRALSVTAKLSLPKHQPAKTQRHYQYAGDIQHAVDVVGILACGR